MTRRRGRDDGAAMVLVLIVVILMAFVTTAFLTKSTMAFRASSVLQTKVRLQYGADAGLEKGIRAMSDDLAQASRTKCLTPFTPVTQIATFTWTGADFPVTVRCQDLQGYAADNASGALYGAAIVTTGGAHSLVTQSAVNTSLDVGGTIYASGFETSGSGGDLRKAINLTKGDYAELGCTGTPTVSNITIASPGGKYCTAITAAQVAPSISLPTRPTTYVAPALVNPNCKVFFPGRYATDPTSLLLSGNNTDNYFASGDYYFDGSYTITLGNNVTLTAGAKSSGDVDGATAACTTDAVAKTLPGAPVSAITGTGAAFYFGGSTALAVGNAELTMYSRPITAGVDVPLNVYAVRASDTGWNAWSGGSTSIISTTNANASLLFNGQINAYDAPVDLFASNPSYAAARAGIVAKTLLLQASASGANLDVSGYGTSSTVGSRIVRLTVSASGTASDAGHADGTAVVRIPNDTNVKPTVLSWSFS